MGKGGCRQAFPALRAVRSVTERVLERLTDLSIGSTVPWLSDAAPHGSSSTAAGAVLLVRRPKRCETSSALAPSASCTAGPRASCARTET